MRLIYLILITFAAPVAALIAWVRGRRNPTRRERLADRIGRPALKFTRPVLWVHAASMGEVQAGAPLITRLLAEYPSHQLLVTTMTTTGAARVKALFADRVAHCYLPYDIPFAVRNFMRTIKPQLWIILETELWPNLLRECQQRRIAVVIASARISPRTATRYRRLKSLFRNVLNVGVSIAAQTPADAAAFKALGANSIQVVGNIKFDIEIPAALQEKGLAFKAAETRDRFVWVAGSTHPGEEIAALEAHHHLRTKCSDALLILVPRHPQRFDDVKKILSQSKLPFITRSSGMTIAADTAVLLIDTMGELLKFYAAADLAFVGGSLVSVGGHSLLEPAALAIPVLCGPHVFNAPEIATLMLKVGAAQCVDSTTAFSNALSKLATNASLRKQMGDAGQQLVKENRGALERIMQLIGKLRF